MHLCTSMERLPKNFISPRLKIARVDLAVILFKIINSALLIRTRGLSWLESITCWVSLSLEFSRSFSCSWINLSNNKKKWYVDCIGAAINVSDSSIINAVSIFIDCTDATTQYRPGTKDNILFVRKPPLFSINERSIYPQIQDKFYPGGYSKIWCWDDITDDDQVALEIVYKVPIIKIPIILI